jgi:peptidoglycan/xylan/chitin deacetylase (PgdA/CDA1 family)
VALTFDDGPSDSFTNKILNILKEKNVPASFFMLGKKLSNNLELAKEL